MLPSPRTANPPPQQQTPADGFESLPYRHVYNQFVIRVPDRDSVQEHLRNCGVATEIYYPLPLHLQECFSSLGYSRGDLPQAEAASKSALALPVYPELSESQVSAVASAVISALGD